MLSSLNRKLLRDLNRLRGQVITIALVVACGIAAFVALQGNYASLRSAQQIFYDTQRFAAVFAELERAPFEIAERIQAHPGVERVQVRVSEAATILLPTEPQPIRARMLSLPREADELLNAIRLESGRRPEPGNSEEVVVLHGFAEAHGLTAGSRLSAVVDGKMHEFRIVGTATSPEYVLAMAPGALSADPGRFAVVWMSPEAIAAAFGMERAFNDVALALTPGASEAAVIDGLDRLLQPYGGTGARPRARQPSNQMVSAELDQLRGLSTFLPVIFLAVAALLVNMVLSRLVLLQQPEIATLKALGYSNREVGLHFLKLVLSVSVAGAALGLGLGAWFGSAMTNLYREFFKFPNLAFSLDARDASVAVLVSSLAAAGGAFGAVRRATTLPPAEAMRPPAPPRYRRSFVDRLRLSRWVGPSVQMVVRELERRPLRAVASVVAIAAGTGLTVVGGWYYDGIRLLVETQFHTVMREDAAVSFLRPVPERAVRELRHLPGVSLVEGVRIVPVRFRYGPRVRDGAIWGYHDTANLRSLRDQHGRPQLLPPDGIVLTDKLAEVLGVSVGEAIRVEILEGQRGTERVFVTGLVSESFGLQGHMRSDALHRWLGQTPLVSLALLDTDPRHDAEVDERLKEIPGVLDVTRRSRELRNFEEQSGGLIITAAAIITLFAATITIGVVYNNARIALSTRGRDLASLRVLGFTRGEISAILLGELAVQVLIALPFGLAFGAWLVHSLAQLADPETYRIPVILSSRTYAFAALVTLLAGTVSAMLVRRRIDQLDLIAVLKTRE